MVGAFAGKVLIHIGNSVGIGVNSDRVGKETSEGRGARARQGRAHARLDDRVRAGYNPPFGIEAWLVQGVCQGLDQPAGSPMRQLGVAVQGDDEPHVRKVIRVAEEDQPTGIFRPCSIDQAVKLFQLSAFALPTDVLLLGFTPGAVPMEKEEALPPIPVLETFEPFDGSLKQSFISLTVHLVRIGIVREEAEKQIGFFVGQVPDFQLLQFAPDRLLAPQQHWHNDQGSKCIWNPRILEIHLRKGAGWK